MPDTGAGHDELSEDHPQVAPDASSAHLPGYPASTSFSSPHTKQSSHPTWDSPSGPRAINANVPPDEYNHVVSYFNRTEPSSDLHKAFRSLLNEYIVAARIEETLSPIVNFTASISRHYDASFVERFMRCLQNVHGTGYDSALAVLREYRLKNFSDEPSWTPPSTCGDEKEKESPQYVPPNFDDHSAPPELAGIDAPPGLGGLAHSEKTTELPPQTVLALQQLITSSRTDPGQIAASLLAQGAHSRPESYVEEIDENTIVFYADAAGIPPGYEPNLVANLPIETAKQITPLSSAEQLTAPLQTAAEFTTFVGTFLGDGISRSERESVYCRVRNIMYLEMVKRWIQTYCHARTNSFSVPRAIEKANTMVKTFITPIFEQANQTHTLALRVRRSSDSTSTQLNLLLQGVDQFLAPLEEQGAHAWHALKVWSGETTSQFIGRADRAAADTGLTITDSAFRRHVSFCVKDVIDQSPDNCANARVVYDLIQTTFKADGANALLSGIQKLSCCDRVLLPARRGNLRERERVERDLASTFPTDGAPPPTPAPAPAPAPASNRDRKAPRFSAYNLAVLKGHSIAGRAATVLPPPQLLNNVSDCWLCADLGIKLKQWVAGSKPNPPGVRNYHNPWRCPEQTNWRKLYSKANPNDNMDEIMPLIDNEFDVYVASCRASGAEIIGNAATRISRSG